ncbi:MAG TPA: glycosyltransferase [Pirellulales bacterium]|jgi:glycosyltransferase involved in cell wall biosynthesis|nr:glycosyltransferase [Pirellulales bacterium]
MHVLIADFDLFRAMGGGQTFYRAIIEKNPHIEFSYLIVDEPADARRPANARAIRYEEAFRPLRWNDYRDIVPTRWCLSAFLLAGNIAWSVRGRRFDVVDLPDYRQIGYFLPAALAHHQVDARRLALSMHGVISTTISLNWASDGILPRALVFQEELQYQAVDVRYGLSAAYLDEWRSRFALPSQYLSPLAFLELPRPGGSALSLSPPDLNFVGRTEKRKGPDLFAELAWWLPAAAYGKARIIGPPSLDHLGVSSEHHLKSFLANRPGKKTIDLCPPATPAELARLFAARGVTFVPSRYDTFNLVAVESLFSGCPTAIGSGAGVCRFLDETFPSVPYVKIDVDRPMSCLPELETVLADYDAYRARLVEALAKAKPAVTGPSLAEIYASPPAHDEAVRRETHEWYERLMSYQAPKRPALVRAKESARQLVRQHTTPQFRTRLRSLHPRLLVAAWKASLLQKLARTPPRRCLDSRLQSHLAGLAPRYQAVAWMPEQTADDLDNKWRQCGQLVADFRVDRTRLWRELARLEDLRGNGIVAATYRLRAMRLAGRDQFHDLPAVLRTLAEHGYHGEAESARAMYGGAGDSQARCREILERALRDHRRPANADYELVDDRRHGECRASVIVSLYDAADKLMRFLETLGLQTMLRSRQAEIVLIDSGSPSDEYRVFRQWIERSGLPAVYARSAQRETIQAAWNRGIGLARGEYLSFLGVDEAILPPALAVLAAELDGQPHVDWVQANSVVTRVDEYGHWASDIMTYDRAGYAQRLVSLETCYLSYVGAMYRRDIHERVGYYDASFGAAGDTEFKNRALPFIRSRAVDQTLGVFWNYPAGQTTCSPRAEIEDLRAWYLHRTPAGVGYALGGEDADEVEARLLAALKYRKSYCRHFSSDLEYASHVAGHLAQASPQSALRPLEGSIAALLQAHRNLDCLSQLSPESMVDALAHVKEVERQVAEEHRRLTANTLEPAYDVFRDNRHEQHQNIWPTECRAGGRSFSTGRQAA